MSMSPTRSVIANDASYGLNGAVFTNDVERAYDVAAACARTFAPNEFKIDSPPRAFGGLVSSPRRPAAGRAGGAAVISGA